MAVLKFRAWHIKAKKYFECVGFEEDTCFIKTQTKRRYGQVLGDKREDYLIEQSTGLHDSFGVEIYESDLVKTYEDSEKPYVVIWDEKCACWGLAMSHKTTLILGNCDRYSAIGNINQHPNIIPHYDPRTTH